MTPVLALVLIMTIASTTIIVPFQSLHAQNITVNVQNASNSDKVSPSVIATLAKPGFSSKYDVAVKGNTVPVSYNIIGGALIGMLADTSRHSLDIAVNPGPDGGAIEVQIPRHLVDAKTAEGKDMPYVVKIDGHRISGEPTGICIGFGEKSCPNIQNTFKETQNTNTDRVLTILFGPESRFVEVVGDTGL